MNRNMNRTLQDAMRLMQTGDLLAATQAIQRGLGLEAAQAATHTPAAHKNQATPMNFIDGEYSVIPESESPPRRARESTDHHESGRIVISEGEFREHRFACHAGSISYKLFVPGGRELAGLPLIVMLHGCSQTPDDFARGTRMNALAQEHGYVVAYPAQSQKQNASRCWNWFRSSDQQRGRGEAALLAELTRHVVKAHRLDERRVYAAGLSAGGAMAAVLGNTHPEIFAAIGVHSGLPFGVAHDLPSAFAAMKQQAVQPAPRAAPASVDLVPAIVFHGDQDTVVDPCNGAAVIEQCLGAPEAIGQAMQTTVERGVTPGGRRYTRTIFTDTASRVMAEQWLVSGAGHAWSGGDTAGSYTDPSGPDASEHMLRFFSGCERRVIN